jgi:hypothetical protein
VAGLDPATHVLLDRRSAQIEDMDARVKPGQGVSFAGNTLQNGRSRALDTEPDSRGLDPATHVFIARTETFARMNES